MINAKGIEARKKLTTLPDYAPDLEAELANAIKARNEFYEEYMLRPWKWGLPRSDEDLAGPYQERVEHALLKMRQYLAEDPPQVTFRQAAYILREMGDIVLTEAQRKRGERPKRPKLPSSDGVIWDDKRIADFAHKRGYIHSLAKMEIVQELVNASGKCQSAVYEALRKQGLTGRKAPSVSTPAEN